jgi:hypothetical protein
MRSSPFPAPHTRLAPYDLLGAVRDQVRFVDVPERGFAVIDGENEPGATPEVSGAFREALQALYAVSYGLRFALKEEGIEYTVGPLEGLWGEKGSLALAPDIARWRLLIWQPDAIGADRLARAVEDAARKAASKHEPRPGLERVRYERWAEGRCAQLLHIGPYEAEAPTIARLHGAIDSAGLQVRGRHHEIYLGDPRRAAPEKLRTLLRRPVA